jgi:cytochrome c553
VIGLGLALLAILDDNSQGKGWFRKDQVADLMLSMGARNEALGNSAEPAPADTHNYARDMILLHERLNGVYPDDLDAEGLVDWDKWAAEGGALARELLTAPDDARQRTARAKLREICAKCHDAQGEDKIIVDPPPRFASQAAKSPEPAAFFFDRKLLATLMPTPLRSTSTKRVMDQGRFRLRDVLAHAGVVKAETDRGREQALVDLRHVVQTIGTLHEDNAGAFVEEGEADWNAWVKDLLDAVDELGRAKNPPDVARKAAAVGKVCETCHDAAEEPDEPIEWRYQSLLQ